MGFCLVAIIWCGSPAVTFGVLQQPLKEGGREGRMGPLGCPYGICLRFLQKKRKGNVRGDLSSSENRILPLCVLFCFRNYVVSPRWVICAFQVRLPWRGPLCKVDGDIESDDWNSKSSSDKCWGTVAVGILLFFTCRKRPASSSRQAGKWKRVLPCQSLHLPR